MKAWFSILALLALPLAGLSAAAAAPTNAPSVILVVGAPGEEEYGSNFLRQAQLWEKACQRGGAGFVTIGIEPNPGMADRDLLQKRLADEPADGWQALWLVLIGHGAFDGHEARFNLRGPDVSAADLAGWLKPIRRPLIVIDTASASAPFLNALSASNRVVITATRSGSERNFARFGQCLAETLADPRSDLDQDGQTSLLESFLGASAQVAEFYKTAGRLATEHALLDDNGDALGTPADWFRGVRAVKKPRQGALDGLRAHQVHLVPNQAEQSLPPETRARRDALELELARLRDARASLSDDRYFDQIEKILLELARLQTGRHTN